MQIFVHTWVPTSKQWRFHYLKCLCLYITYALHAYIYTYMYVRTYVLTQLNVVAGEGIYNTHYICSANFCLFGAWLMI